MAIDYEWRIEVGDDVNLNLLFFDTYAEAQIEYKRLMKSGHDILEIVLVRRDYNHRYMEETVAYVAEDVIPDCFEDAYQRRETRVPKRFKAEVTRCLSTSAQLLRAVAHATQ